MSHPRPPIVDMLIVAPYASNRHRRGTRGFAGECAECESRPLYSVEVHSVASSKPFLTALCTQHFLHVLNRRISRAPGSAMLQAGTVR